jgi:hypothetical protein
VSLVWKLTDNYHICIGQVNIEKLIKWIAKVTDWTWNITVVIQQEDLIIKGELFWRIIE